MTIKILYAILLVLVSVAVWEQKHIDTPFLQDFAGKYELVEDLQGTTLQNVRSDRNELVYMMASEAVLLTGEDYIP